MTADSIQRVLIIGAGTMGQQIGMQCALFGLDVVLYDTSPKAREAVLPSLRAYLVAPVAASVFTTDQVEAAFTRLTITNDAKAAAAEIDLVSESIPEDPKLKGAVLGEFHRLCPPRTIFTTNTSTLAPSQFAQATGRPERFAAFHFHTPVWYANVVDVMPHPGTAPDVVEILGSFAGRIGQIPIVLHEEHRGYIFNSMLNVLLAEALTMAATGVASPEEIDRAWMGVTKMGIGPFGIIDLVGVDTVWKITDYWAGKAFWMRHLRRNATYLKAFVDRGELGSKTGRGFYQYPNPRFQDATFLSNTGGG